MDDLVKFLRARLDEDAEPCEGASEYVDCRDLSERRVRDVEAKRQIVDRCASIADGSAWDLAEEVLRLLALPYVDHPDYREEWRP